MKTRGKKLLALLLTLAMCLSLLPMGAMAADNVTWTKVALADISVTDTIAITMTTGTGETFALSSEKGATAAPPAVAVSVNQNTFITADSNNLGWNISKNGDDLTIYPAGRTDVWLSNSNKNNGVRVNDTAKVWTISSSYGYLYDAANNRNMGVYNKTDWRTYAPIHDNIANQTLAFYKLGGGEPPATDKVSTPVASPKSGSIVSGSEITLSCTPQDAKIYYTTDGNAPTSSSTEYTAPIAITADTTLKAIGIKAGLTDSDVMTEHYTVLTKSDISAAREAADGTVMMVEGVVTTPYDADANTTAKLGCYIQDETGGILLYGGALPALNVGDKVRAVGSAKAFSTGGGVKHELEKITSCTVLSSSATVEPVVINASDIAKNDAKLVRISDLKVTDKATDSTYKACTLTLTGGGVTVTAVLDNRRKDFAAGELEAKVNVDDIVTVTGISEIGKIALRTVDDVTVTEQANNAAAPLPSLPSGAEVVTGTKLTFTCATTGAEIKYVTADPAQGTPDWKPVPQDGFAITGNVGDTVQLWVKATKSGLQDSDVVALTYTIKENAPPSTDPIPDNQFPANSKNIQDFIALADSTSDTVTGQIVYRFGNYDSMTSAILQDVIGGTTYSLQVFSDLSDFEIGDVVTLTGEKTTYGAVPQIQKITASAKVSSPAAFAAEEYAGFDDLQADKENRISRFVVIRGVTLGAYSADGSTTITDSKGKTMPIYRAPSYPVGVTAGDVVDLYAVLSRYSSTWQLRAGTPDANGFATYRVTNDTKEPVITLPDSWLPAAVGKDYAVSVTINDYLMGTASIKYKINAGTEKSANMTASGTTYTYTIPAAEITAGGAITFTITATDAANNTSTSETQTVTIEDLPQVSAETPARGSYTGADVKRPKISVTFANAGAAPTIKLTLTKDGGSAVVTDQSMTVTGDNAAWTPAADLDDGLYTAKVVITRADNKSLTYTWTFTVGEATLKLYFGQLHSHTQYSDGAGSLEDALKYIKNTAKNNNVQFVAFTDHSNSLDTSSDPNPAEALYDMSKASANAQETWKSYKDAIAAFNNDPDSGMLALGGYEMTWSGGPGHMNTFNSPGFVSRNNKTLNDKSNTAKDKGMQSYYDLLSQEGGKDTISQFNHPGKTFGTFTDFAYWNPIIDSRISLLEVGNGEGQIGAGGYYPSYEHYTTALDKGWHVAPTNNQDNHKGKWGDANDARTVIITDDFSEQGLYKAMQDRNLYATEDKNLQINYTVNDQIMGSIIPEVPDELSIHIAITDPDSSVPGDKISTVELVVNGGRVAKTWDKVNDHSFVGTIKLTPEYSYYYLRVTQADTNIAVTAPVWVGKGTVVGIGSFTSDTAVPVTGEAVKLTTNIFNSEESAVTLKTITYALEDGTVIKAESPNTTIAPMSTIDHTINYTPTKPIDQTVVVTAVVSVEGKDNEYTARLLMSVLDPTSLVYVGIDGSHYNEYVNGNYKDSMGNFTTMAAGYDVRVNTLNTSEALVAACSNPKYKMLVLTAPSRRDGTALRADYKNYTDAEITAIADFAKAGGTVIVAGWADYYENYAKFPAEDHMAAQQNRLLEAIGSTLRISDDEALDEVHNAGGGASNYPRLYLSNYNFDNPLTEGIVFDKDHIFDGQGNYFSQVFSQYGGATIYAVDAQGNPTSTLPASVSPIVSGFDTTKGEDKDGDGLGGNVPKYPAKQGDETVNCVLAAASETVTHEGGKTSQVIVSGGAFMSNFEIQATLDNSNELTYSNYNILENLVSSLNQPTVTKIADLPLDQEGYRFTIEGLVTSNTSGYDKDTAFFDCTYLQDETGGINVFPVSGNYQIGQKLRVSGSISSYQGEPQLAVKQIKVLNSVPETVAPADVTTKQVADNAVRGMLVRVVGEIVSFEVAEGTIQTIMVKDSSGVEARIFIDGYITPSKDAALRSILEVGKQISAVGLASYDNTFNSSAGGPYPRIRVRDRADIMSYDSEGKIVILHTNDVHCQVDQAKNTDGAVTNIGYAGVAGYRDLMAARYGNGNVTLVDAGDALQGGPIGTLSKGGYIVDIMNQVGYDMAAPGNHEFDYGMERFLELAKNEADYSYVCCNFIDLKTGSPVFDPYKMVTYGEIKVAYVGIDTPESFTKSTPAYFQDAEGNYIYGFCEGNDGKDLYDQVQKTVDAARADGADYVVAMGHLGIDNASKPWTSNEVVANTTGIDVMLDGHSHSTYEKTLPNKNGESVVMAQTGTKLANIGKIVIDTKTGKISSELVSGYAEEQTETAAFIKGINDEFKDLLATVVAKTDVELTVNDPDTGKRAIRSAETNLGDLCADAYRVMLGADVGFVNGGGIRTSIKAGDITYGQIIEVHPFGNAACLIETSGQHILDALEMGSKAVPGELGGFLQVSGLTYTINKSVPSSVVTNDKGEFVKVDGAYRVTDVKIGGQPLDVNKTYTLAAHDYMLKNGGDGFVMFKGDKLIKDSVMLDNQVLIDYIVEKLGGVVGSDYANPRGQGRISIVDTVTPDVPSGGGGSSISTVRPDAVKEGDASVQVKLPSANAKLNDAANEKVIALNAAKPVILSGGGLYVTIPAGTLSKGADVNAMLVNPKDKGNVIQVTLSDGAKVILPFSVVGGGSASYLAKLVGSYRIIDNAKTFPDVAEGHWAGDAVSFAASHELFNGMGDGTFNPTAPMTRSMLVTVLARLDSSAGGGTASFRDVPANAWYAESVAWAAENKLVEGDGVDFRPDDPITREQLCTILARYLDYAGLTLPETSTAGGFSDTASVSPWASDAVSMALRAGLLTGKPGGLIDPQGQASRAEIAVMLQRFVESVLT